MTIAKGAISKILGIEIGLDAGKTGSLILIKFKGKDESKIKVALRINTLCLLKFNAMIKTPIPNAR